MPLTFRLIARLDIKSPNLIKTIRLEGVRPIGDPYEFATRYNSEGIDEILYLDTVASLYGRNSLAELLAKTTEQVFAPVTVAGGIRSVGDVDALMRAGADMVAVNTSAIKRPELITEIAEKYGSQAITVQIDAKRKDDGWEAYCDGGREPTGKDAIEWARFVVGAGGGQILATSIDNEGTSGGCDTNLAAQIVAAVSVPVIISGGIGSVEDVVAVAQTGAAGVAMAGALHYGKVSLEAMREALDKAGVPVRP